MSLRDVSLFYVLGEDAFHRSFVRAWLRQNGVSPRGIFTVEPPADKSGGLSFLLQRCETEVKAARIRNASKAKTRVIVVIDADDKTVQERLLEVNQATSATEDDKRIGLVCILVPKRHIETWVYALAPSDPAVDEVSNYKQKTSEEVKAAARRLANLVGAPSAPPSLVHGYAQLQNLKDG